MSHCWFQNALGQISEERIELETGRDDLEDNHQKLR